MAEKGIRPEGYEVSANSAKKAPVIEEISALLDGAQSIVLVDYRGLTVEEDTKLRKEFREAGVEYKVYKNTLLKRALAGTDFEGAKDFCAGPTAIAVAKEDAIAPARVIFKNIADMPKLEVKGGIVEKEVYDPAGLEALSKVPSRETLLSRLLGSMQSPMANFARVIKQIAESKEDAA